MSNTEPTGYFERPKGSMSLADYFRSGETGTWVNYGYAEHDVEQFVDPLMCTINTPGVELTPTSFHKQALAKEGLVIVTTESGVKYVTNLWDGLSQLPSRDPETGITWSEGDIAADQVLNSKFNEDSPAGEAASIMIGKPWTNAVMLAGDLSPVTEVSFNALVLQSMYEHWSTKTPDGIAADIVEGQAIPMYEVDDSDIGIPKNAWYMGKALAEDKSNEPNMPEAADKYLAAVRGY